MSMPEADWLAAMDAEPESARCMAMLSDWWQGRVDPRWEPMGELARLGKVGHHGEIPSKRVGIYSATVETRWNDPNGVNCVVRRTRKY